MIDALKDRSAGQCELCTSKEDLDGFHVDPSDESDLDTHAVICATCREQIEDSEKMNADHWRCLNDSMWSEVPAVKVLAWRMLDRIKDQGWPSDLLDMLYIEDGQITWAKAGADTVTGGKIVHKDSNGHILEPGDSVVLIKDLKVKGANFIAKRGTPVRRISLVQDNAGQIEGRVGDQHIVILTEFVKKSK